MTVCLFVGTLYGYKKCPPLTLFCISRVLALVKILTGPSLCWRYFLSHCSVTCGSQRSLCAQHAFRRSVFCVRFQLAMHSKSFMVSTVQTPFLGSSDLEVTIPNTTGNISPPHFWSGHLIISACLDLALGVDICWFSVALSIASR